MARFHFHSHNGEDHRDVEGTELPDHRTAKVEALKSLGQLLIQESAGLDDSLTMEVTDDQGLDLYHLTVQVTPSPAIKTD